MKYTNWIFAILSTYLVGCASDATPDHPEGSLALINANILDPIGEKVDEKGVIIIDGATIIQRTNQVPPRFQGQIIDLTGKWLLPALNDMHTHSFGNVGVGGVSEFFGSIGTAKRMLYAGVTTFLDLFFVEDDLVTDRQKLRGGEETGAELLASLSCMTAPNGHCTQFGVATRTMDSPEQAREQVIDLAKKHPDVIKIVYNLSWPDFPTISKETLFAAVDEAKNLGLKTVIHVDGWVDLRDAVNAGATAVTHVPVGDMPEDIPELMLSHGTVLIPTLPVFIDVLEFANDSKILEHPLVQALTPPEVLRTYQTESFRSWVEQNRAWLEFSRTTRLAGLRQLADSGVKLVAGSDSGNVGAVQGFSLHRELEGMVEAGMTPWQALATATVNTGEFLGRSFGVNAGDEANLLILDASPLEDISNTQAIHMIIQRGQVVDREQLLDEPGILSGNEQVEALEKVEYQGFKHMGAHLLH